MTRIIKMEKQFINFQFSLFGLHYYPGHPTLSTPHAHRFELAVLLQTFKDRGIEFIAFRDNVRQEMFDNYPIACTYERNHQSLTVLDFGSRSCETLCEELVEIVATNLPPDYPAADIQVLVQESEERAAGVWRGKIFAA